MVFKRIAAVLLWLLVTLTSAFGFVSSELETASGDFFCGTLEDAGRNDSPARFLCRINGWLNYDTLSECAVAANKIDDAGRLWNKSDFNGTRVYQRNDLIDPALVDGRGRSNLQRMQNGLAPVGPDGHSINLHHTIQSADSPLAEVTRTFHQQNSSVIHINPNTIPSGIDRSAFNTFRSNYWKNRANDF